MANLYIADIHFGHQNVLAFDNRPFPDVKTHDEVIIGNWNNTCSIYDDVYMLGDISYYNVTKTIEILKQLPGKLHLIVGNHDNKFLKNRDFRSMFVEIDNYKELDIGGGAKAILSHYPIVAFNGQFRKNNIHLYGHVHCSPQWEMIERFKQQTENERGKGTCAMFNCGIMMDYIGYAPKTLEEIVSSCENRSIDDIIKCNRRLNDDE